ncbi:MAG: tRNA dihydrouridine synthase DusB [Candidatus Margulisbacteria bacterium]|nr:tRNA dihydrouridine synthase DusB [Candidatus Margulisiibacteriota bacterium]
MRAIAIGPYTLKTNVLLAPLSGCSDLAFRLICREHGAKFCFYEMIDANSLVHHSRGSDDLLKTTAKDKPIAAQLVGGDADIMLKAAKILLEKVDIPFLDINAACPVKKMIQKFSGANLLRDPKALYKIVKTLASKLDLPITVKLRIGYNHVDLKEVTTIAKNCEKNGAAALFVHGRTRSQLYAGEINYEAIKAIKHAVKVPVFGSGNIFSPEMAKKMFDLTDCDGITVARGAFGNPWIFKQIEKGEAFPVSLAEKLKVLKKHLSYIEKYKVTRSGYKVGFMRKIAIWYLKGFPEAAKIRAEVTRLETYEKIIALIDSIIID